MQDADKDGWTALHSASRNRHESTVKLLLEKGADVGASNKDRQTALHFASHNGHELVVELLLKHRADLQAITVNG